MADFKPSSARTLALLCLAIAGWAFGFGLGAPLASLWLRDSGFDEVIIGLNTGVYYLSIAVAAVAVPWLMRRWGNGPIIAGMIFSGIMVAAFPWVESLTSWFVLRALQGVAAALSLIPTETRVNRDAPPEKRACHFGFYAFAVALGWALGNLVGLQMYEDAPRLAFALGGLMSCAGGAIVWCWLSRPEAPPEVAQDHIPLPWRCSCLGLSSAWCQGFLEGGMVCLLPVYLLFIGLSAESVGWLTSGIMIGVILFQVPVAWLADRLGKSLVLLGCYVVTGLGLAILPFCEVSPWLCGWLFLVGACSGSFYPLGLAILGDRLPEAALARANAWYLAINCLGSWIGPGIAGFAMRYYGKSAFFVTGEAAVLLVLGICAATRSFAASTRSADQASPPTQHSQAA